MLRTDIAISVNGLEKSYAGKTTTIKILPSLLKPDKGSAQICGFDVVHQLNL